MADGLHVAVSGGKGVVRASHLPGIIYRKRTPYRLTGVAVPAMTNPADQTQRPASVRAGSREAFNELFDVAYDEASGERGEFRFAGVRAGTYRLRAASLGYSPVTTPAVVVAGDTVHLVIRIGIDAVPLAPLEVVTRPQALHRHPGLAAFAERARKRLGGAFILREEVEERHPRNLTDLLRLAGSMTVMDHARGGIVFNMRTQCAPSVYIDGRFIAGHEGGGGGGGERVYEAINSVHWGEVEGIEIYPGVSTVPAEFSGSRAGCGIVAIWLTRG